MDNSSKNFETREKIPESYNAPHDYWRPYQREGYEAILNVTNQGKTAIIEGPTGMGKSLWPTVIGNDQQVLVLCATKDLLEQYNHLYDFSVIKGRGNYLCTEPKRLARWQEVYGLIPTADDCPGMKECKTNCPYKQAKAQAIQANKACTTYAYAWYSEWWHQRPGYLFADEAHNLAMTVISNLAQLRVTEKQRQRWDLPPFPACSGTAKWAVEQVSDWIASAKLSLQAVLQRTKDEREQARGKLLVRKLGMLSDLIWQGTWYIKGTNINEPFLSCRPVNPAAFADRLLAHQDKRILMSATIGDAEMLAAELGIKDYEFHSFPHNIPAERRPVYLIQDAPAMSYKSTYQDYEHQADCIANVCYQHKGERILVHTTRWRHATDLAHRLARRGLQNRVWVPEQGMGRIEMTSKLLDNIHYPDMIAIGPSFWEGLDMRQDLCRAVVVGKVPFSDRSDPVVAARLRQENGNKWDRWCAALKVVQGCGRGVRDADDYAVAYIADANWTRVAKYAPKWFEVQS